MRLARRYGSILGDFLRSRRLELADEIASAEAGEDWPEAGAVEAAADELVDEVINASDGVLTAEAYLEIEAGSREPTDDEAGWIAQVFRTHGLTIDASDILAMREGDDGAGEADDAAGSETMDQPYGTAFAAAVNAAIDALVTDEKPRELVIDDVALATGMSAGDVSAALGGGGSACPTRETVTAIAGVLGVASGDLLEAAKTDGCTYEDEAEEGEAPAAEPAGESSPAEMRARLTDMRSELRTARAEAARLKPLAEVGERVLVEARKRVIAAAGVKYGAAEIPAKLRERIARASFEDLQLDAELLGVDDLTRAVIAGASGLYRSSEQAAMGGQGVPERRGVRPAERTHADISEAAARYRRQAARDGKPPITARDSIAAVREMTDEDFSALLAG